MGTRTKNLHLHLHQHETPTPNLIRKGKRNPKMPEIVSIGNREKRQNKTKNRSSTNRNSSNPPTTRHPTQQTTHYRPTIRPPPLATTKGQKPMDRSRGSCRRPSSGPSSASLHTTI